MLSSGQDMAIAVKLTVAVVTYTRPIQHQVRQNSIKDGLGSLQYSLLTEEH